MELGRSGGLRRQHTFEQPTDQIAPPESAGDVRRMLAETMAEVKAGRMDPKVANTVAYVGTVLLRAYEADASSAAITPAQPYVPLIYRSLARRIEPEDDEVMDLYPSKPVGLPAAEVPCVLPAPSSAAPTPKAQPDIQIEVEILES